MINQVFLKSNSSHIVCIIKSKYSISEVKGVAVLLPGFSQSASDIDYFLTNLSNELNSQGYATIQVDLYGHGDSYGHLSDLDIQIVECNILSVYEYAKRLYNDKPIIGISRGIYGNMLCNKNISNMFTEVIAINPVKTNIMLENYLGNNKNDVLEISDILSDSKPLEDLFVSMGAETTNIRGQKICNAFLFEMFNFINDLQYPTNATILSTYNDDNEINKVLSVDKINCTIEYISTHCFIRNLDWQLGLIKKVVEIMRELYT